MELGRQNTTLGTEKYVWHDPLYGGHPLEQGVLRRQSRCPHDDPTSKQPKQIVLSVKAGKTGPAHVRDLRGVLEREEKRGAVMAALQTLAPPTRDMIKEAAGVGFYRSPWGRHPKIQFLTAEDLLKGSGLDYPAPKQTNVSLRKAHPSARDVLQGTLPGVVKGESKKKATRKSKRRMS